MDWPYPALQARRYATETAADARGKMGRTPRPGMEPLAKFFVSMAAIGDYFARRTMGSVRRGRRR
jgi:hypothetical protein